MTASLPPRVADLPPLATWVGRNGVELLLRPLRATDAPQILLALNKLSPAARRNRFFRSVGEFTPQMAAELASIDPVRAYGLLVLRREAGMASPPPASAAPGSGGTGEFPIAGGRLVMPEAGSLCCEFSLLVGDAWHGQGLGGRILDALIAEAGRRGLREMYASILADNLDMLRLARSRGFVIEPCAQDPDLRRALRVLTAPQASATTRAERLAAWFNQHWGERLRDWLRLH